jgi:hypothetical protein
MDAWSLNQTQTRRCIDYLSRYRYASDQQDVSVVHLSRKRPRRVKLLDYELDPARAIMSRSPGGPAFLICHVSLITSFRLQKRKSRQA